MRRSSVGLALLFAAALPMSGSAQTGVAVGGAALMATADGEDFRDILTGYGGDIEARKAWSNWSFGGGLSYLSYGVVDIKEKVQNIAIFVEPRYAIADREESSWAPYVLLRGTYAYSRLNAEGSPSRRTGLSIGGGLGTLYRLRRSLDIDLSVTWSITRFSNLHQNGNTLAASSIRGTAIGIRLGLLLW